jgi:hypothetical protein
VAVPLSLITAKGPKDIIEHGTSGYLAESWQHMVELIQHHFNPKGNIPEMVRCAQLRASEYQPATVIQKLLEDCGHALPATSTSMVPPQPNTL